MFMDHKYFQLQSKKERFKPSNCKDIGNGKNKVLTKTQFHFRIKKFGFVVKSSLNIRNTRTYSQNKN